MYTQHTTWRVMLLYVSLFRRVRSHLSLDVPALYSILLMEDNSQLQKNVTYKYCPFKLKSKAGAHVIASCKLESPSLSLTSCNQIMALLVR